MLPGSFGAVHGHSIHIDAFKSTIIVGSAANQDKVGLTCHVVDDIAAGLALLTAGGELLIKRGTYTPVATLLVNVPGTKIVFEEGVIINKAAGLAMWTVSVPNVQMIGPVTMDGQIDAAATDMITVSPGVNRAIFRDLIFTQNPNGNGINATATIANQTTRIYIEDCEFENVGSAIIYNNTQAGQNFTQSRIHRCRINASTIVGIQLFGVTDVWITETEVRATSAGAGIHVALGVARSTGVVISDCYVIGSNGDNIQIEDSDECTVDSCQARGSVTGHGIIVGPGISTGDSNVLTGNICTGNNTNGIIINTAGSDWNTVVANYLRGNAVSLTDNGTNTQIGHNPV